MVWLEQKQKQKKPIKNRFFSLFLFLIFNRKIYNENKSIVFSLSLDVSMSMLFVMYKRARFMSPIYSKLHNMYMTIYAVNYLTQNWNFMDFFF